MHIPLFLRKLLIRSRIAQWLPGVQRHARGATAYLHHFSDRVLTAPLDALLDDAAFPDALSPDTIHLAQPAPRFDSLTGGILRSVSLPRQSAPINGLPLLREMIAVDHAQQFSQGLDPNSQVLVTHGSTGAFTTVLDTFINPGCRVAAFEPTSPLFGIGLQSRRARINWVPTWMEEGRTRFHLGPFVKAMKNAKMLVMADPNNPTGGVFAPEDLEQIVWWAKHYDVLIYLDTTLSRYRYDDNRCKLPGLQDARDRLLMSGSVSKGYGVASLRVGWLTGPAPLIDACTLSAAMSNPFVPLPCQQMAVAVMQTLDDAAFAPIREGFAQRRRYVYERLQQLGLQPAWPIGGFSFWVPVTPLGQNGRTFAQTILEDRRILVSPGDVFGPSGKGFIRLSYAAEEGRLREGLARLAEYLRDLRRVPEMPPQPELAEVA